MTYKIGWFSTGRGPGSRNLLATILESIEGGTIRAKLSFVFCSREPGEGEGSDRYLAMAGDHDINLICFSSRKFMPEMRRAGKGNPDLMREWRIAYDREIMSRLAPFPSDVNVLAGYMLIVGDEMCERYDLINLHPAAPDGPAGTWKEVIWQLIEERAERSGVMIHLATKELDRGPPVAFCTFPLRGTSLDPLWERHEEKVRRMSLARVIREEGDTNELFREIRKRGTERELPLMVHTLKAFSEGKIAIHAKKVFIDSKEKKRPYCLTEQIERSLENDRQDRPAVEGERGI